MRQADWILTEAEQAAIFPMDFAKNQEDAAALPSIFQPVFSDKKAILPADFFQRSPIQRELFELDSYHDAQRTRYFRHFPQSIADFFASQIKKRVKKYGALYAHEWFLAQRDAQLERIQLIMAHYCEALAIFEAPYFDLASVESLPFAMTEGENAKPLYWGKQRYNESDEAFSERQRLKIAEAAQLFPSFTERLSARKNYLDRARLTPLYQMNSKQIEQMAHHFTLFITDELEQGCKVDVESKEEAFSVLLNAYIAVGEKVRRFNLSLDEVKTEQALTSAILRYTDIKTWKRKFTLLAKRQREHLKIAVGMVHANLGGYVSNERLREYEEQKRANFAFIKHSILVNALDESEQVELLHSWLKSNSNPKINRIELMTRLRGYEEIADEEGYIGVFVTLTAPSKFHAMLQQGGYNPKWNGASPTMTNRYLGEVWARARAALSRANIPFYGLRVAEPHHDATPHYHFVLWTLPETMRELKRILYRYAIEEDSNEKGAKRRRCTFKLIDKEKGSATAYVAKYISKNIDGLGMDDLLSDETGKPAKEASARTKAWATLWRIRQFQFVGGASVSGWRELRRLGSQKQKDEIIDTARAVCDVGCYASYLMFQGGVFVKRADQKVRLHYIETAPNKYEETRNKVNGVVNQQNGVVVKTRLKEWKIERMSKAYLARKEQAQQEARIAEDIRALEKAGLPALGLVSVTVRRENRDGESEIIRKQLKQAVMIAKGRVTDYQIDDLLKGKSLRLGTFGNERLSLRYANRQLIEERETIVN